MLPNLVVAGVVTVSGVGKRTVRSCQWDLNRLTPFLKERKKD